jgi:hypothetical protein
VRQQRVLRARETWELQQWAQRVSARRRVQEQPPRASEVSAQRPVQREQVLAEAVHHRMRPLEPEQPLLSAC